MKGFLSACVAILAIAAAGCGSASPAATGTDPASLAPANTLAYASLTIAPSGAEREGFDGAFGKLLGGDPERTIGEAFTRAAQTSGGLDYDTDVKPWLGDSVSAIVTRVGRGGCDFALLVASTDDDKAQAAIDKDLKGAASQDYRGVTYKAVDDRIVNGVVGHFLVAGTAPAFRAVVDTSLDGNSLAESDQWKTSVGDRADGKVGLGYLDLKGVLGSLASQLPGVQRVAAPLLLGLVQIHPFVATLDARPDSLVVDVSSPGTKPDARGPDAASSPLIERLPADSWLAAGVPDVGVALGKLTTVLKANPLTGAKYAGMQERVRAQTGIDLDKDVIAALGDVALFVRGDTPATVGGGLVVQSPTPARLTLAMRRVRAAAHPRRAIAVRRTAHAAIVTTGPGAMRAALSGAGRLGDTALFRTAAAAIGGRPTLFADLGPALKLAAASPRHHGDEHFQRALPRLEHLRYFALGARREGNLDVLRVVAGLH